ncbi:L,D-transpeptidase family protein [Sandarakinorhabdus rubra]|uniref:L,D-transpeptidase family protein n=1 Tax=Sandarakinorhabdus rubra TaxID=2672568 RepID=UPI001F01A678|nr:L,D-transpeptidase family protein [Sandarakinorhabdus rubra]
MELTARPGQRRQTLRTVVALAGLTMIGLLALSSSRAEDPVANPVPQMATAQAAAMPRVVYSRYQSTTLKLADGQTKSVLSLLNIRHKMKFGEYVWDDNGIAAGDTWIIVDLAGQTMSVFRAGHEIGTAPILYGADSKPTPVGVFPVLEKARDHRSNLYDADMPFMLRLSWDGVAIHASNVRAGEATHGCIGVPPEFAKRLFNQVRVGDLVSVTKA